MIYDTKLGPLFTELESKYGYDDYTNLAFYLLNEIGNKDSIFKPYLGKLSIVKKDILPRQPLGAAFKYWSFANEFEKEVPNMPIISNFYFI